MTNREQIRRALDDLLERKDDLETEYYLVDGFLDRVLEVLEDVAKDAYEEGIEEGYEAGYETCKASSCSS
jgi:flagellar biosynthesis/type III secretory pathway protein FliH